MSLEPSWCGGGGGGRRRQGRGRQLDHAGAETARTGHRVGQRDPPPALLVEQMEAFFVIVFC